jgi:predicted transposase/invertase (TIGR01784 family)
MSISKYLDPKNDFAFKKIFGTEKHKDILIHFINDMLGFVGENQIKEVSFLKTSQDPDVAAKKQSIVDVLCVDALGRQYIVEMQVAKSTGFEKRAQYYAAKAYVSQMNSGDAYANLKEIIFLAITDFIMFPDKSHYKSDHVILDKDTHDHELKDFYFSFLELPKFNKTIDRLDSVVDKWAYFFKHASETSEEDVEKLAGHDIVIRQAYEALNQYGWSDIERNTYEQLKKSDMDARAIEQFKLEEAVNNALFEVAKRMSLQGDSIEKISQITGLSVADIKQLLD